MLAAELVLIQQNEDESIETYETEYHLEQQRLTLHMQLDALHEMGHVEFDDVKGLLTTFHQLDHHDVRFRTFIRNYIRSITVYCEKVVFQLDFGFCFFDDAVKEFTAERSSFKTPSQK